MPTKATISAKCPVCGMSYRVPAGAAGHRARCARCHTVFRVEPPADTPPSPPPARIGRRMPVEVPRRLPTEEDILGWLSEGQDDEGLTDRDEALDALLDSGAAAVAQGAGAGLPTAAETSRRLAPDREDTLSRVGMNSRDQD